MRKEKASDIYNKQTPVMARKVDTFAEAYPTVASLQLEVVEDEGALGKTYAPRSMTERQFSAVVDCHNQFCYGGGVDIGRFLHRKVGAKQTDIDETLDCQGHEGTKTKQNRSCTHRFSVKGTIVYKPEIVAN
jgi:hypothetical protein